MNNIRMVDLQTQYLRYKEEIDTEMQKVVDSTAFINGPAVKEFCTDLENYLGSKHVIPCANGTDALQIALMSLGLKPGDEVITVSFTFVATGEVISLLNLTPVFVDVDPKTFVMDLTKLEDAITDKTKAIIPVHLYGQCPNMEELMSIANKHGVPVVEDNAQGIGADCYTGDGGKKKSGTFGAFGCTSFFPSKNLGCYGDGGALYTDDDDLAEKARIICNHGSKVKYYNDWIGVNSRLDAIQAAVLKVKLQYLDDFISRRQEAAAVYDEAFKDANVQTPTRSEYSSHVFHQYTLIIEEGRDEMVAALGERGIPAMIYYPVPMHEQKAYSSDGRVVGDMAGTSYLKERVLSLPMHTELDATQLGFITSNFIELLKR